MTPLLARWGHMGLAPQFECWDCEPAVLPPRSRLYSLMPIGIGSMFVESLTGYVSRLADAHAVSVGNLVGRELLLVSAKPKLPYGPFVPRDGTTKSLGFRGRACSTNGWGERASRWVGALEQFSFSCRPTKSLGYPLTPNGMRGGHRIRDTSQ